MTFSVRNKRKTKTGVVKSDKCDKTITVEVERVLRHPVYKKTIRRTKKYTAHDEKNECKIGDRVLIMETRPLSKTKRWRLVKILSAPKV